MNILDTTSRINDTGRLKQSGETQQRAQPSRSVQNLIILFGLDTLAHTSQSESPAEEGRS